MNEARLTLISSLVNLINALRSERIEDIREETDIITNRTKMMAVDKRFIAKLKVLTLL